MFAAAQILSFITQPVAWASILLVLALLTWRRRPAWSRRLATAALAVLVLLGWQAPVDAWLRCLENQSPAIAADADLRPYAGVVLLGGALERSSMWRVPGRIALNEHAERMIVPVGLMQRFPHLRVLYTGGTVESGPDEISEAARAKIFFDLMEIPPGRVLYEDQSRTTYENAVFSARLAAVDPKARWLLLTSAAHMPRSMATFRAAGWNVTAYPVDYKAPAVLDWTAYSLLRGVEKWHYALHETIGYAMYWITGRL